MNISKIFPLHWQIIAGLILGAVLGAFFNVDKEVLLVDYEKDGVEKTYKVESWESIEVRDAADSTYLAEFFEFDQIRVIRYFDKLKRKAKSTKILIVRKSGAYDLKFENVRKIRRQETIATKIRPLGDLFIKMLSFLAIPLVIASLIVGAASLEDVKKLGRIGGKTFGIYVATTALAITIGLTCANLIRPGDKIPQETQQRLETENAEVAESAIESQLEIDLVDFIVEIVPKNPIEAMSSGNMLQIVFFAVVFGVALTFVGKKKSKTIIRFFDGASDAMIVLVNGVMKFAPFGVFALIAATIADFGIEILTTLIWYILAVLLGLLIQTLVVYPALVKFLGKFSLGKYFKDIRTAQAIAFSASSSAATLPVTIDCVENKMGVPKKIAGFVLPLGATINMDGTALYQGVAAVFIAQFYGIDLDITAQLTIVITAVLASIGTAPVPGVGIIMLVLILQSVHIPPEGIALIIGVDRILDMARTVTNVSGDAAVAVAVAGTEKN